MSVNDFRNRPAFPLKNFNRLMIERSYHFLVGRTHYANNAVMRKLTEKTSFRDDLKEKAPDACITFGN